ncbi:MAG: hypothetical protein PG981_000106 [Wolbachia endosymbiont of Ctenocephalides orientis wCori]|nr:MAG: hypothetical protein PG981_000106 [Wolbachia endosymbiont of Ctenocephalides orientis wCori]
MDFTLGHELGHILQMCFGSEKVKEVYKTDTELIANIIGLEVEKINHRPILRQNDEDDENKAGQTKNPETEAKQTSKDINTDTFSLFDVIFSTIQSIFSPILSFFSWIFNFNNEEEGNRQPRSLSLLSDVDNDFLEDYTNNNLSDHYHSYDELIM